jgi:hypothetical protein
MGLGDAMKITLGVLLDDGRRFEVVCRCYERLASMKRELLEIGLVVPRGDNMELTYPPRRIQIIKTIAHPEEGKPPMNWNLEGIEEQYWHEVEKECEHEDNP